MTTDLNSPGHQFDHTKNNMRIPIMINIYKIKNLKVIHLS